MKKSKIELDPSPLWVSRADIEKKIKDVISVNLTEREIIRSQDYQYIIIPGGSGSGNIKHKT